VFKAFLFELEENLEIDVIDGIVDDRSVGADALSIYIVHVRLHEAKIIHAIDEFTAGFETII
jgi:hypothetical protein